MSERNIIAKAETLLRKRKFTQVVSLLEPLVIDFRDSYRFFYILGVACLYLGDVGGAESYFKRARSIKLNDVDLLLAQSVLFLRRASTDRALEYCLDALQIEPNSKKIKAYLSNLKKVMDPELINQMVYDGRIKKFYPELGINPNIIKTISFVSVILVIGVISFFVLKPDNPIKGNRADLSDFVLTIDEKSSMLEQNMGASVYKYILSKEQVQKAYSEAQSKFQSYNDNEAQKQINLILNSNASSSIKQKARMLMSYIDDPTFDTIKEQFSYTDVKNDPYLYLDCWVTWQGRISNIEESEEISKCDLLVGYEDFSKVEGIVPLEYKTGLVIDPEKPIKILGQVSIQNSKLLLKVKSVYQPISGHF